jgi:xanthine dehydrogenase accessory factor
MSESTPNDRARPLAAVSREILEAARGGTPIAVATVIAAPEASVAAIGDKLAVRNDGTRAGSLGGGDFEAAVAEDALAQLSTVPRVVLQSYYYLPEGGRIHRLEAKGAAALEVMIEVSESPAALLVIGGGHVGLAVATIGAFTGFSVAVQDDRASFANPERFPMADHILTGDVTEQLNSFPIGANTYVVLVSRGHKQDETALRLVVSRGAAYVGMIGSRRRVGTVLRHLAEEGFAIEDLERVRTPIGIDIGAETPEEIAVSIMAEVIMTRRGGSGRVMQESRSKIAVPESTE